MFGLSVTPEAFLVDKLFLQSISHQVILKVHSSFEYWSLYVFNYIFYFYFSLFLLLSFAKTNKNYLPANMDDDNEYYERFLWYD